MRNTSLSRKCHYPASMRVLSAAAIVTVLSCFAAMSPVFAVDFGEKTVRWTPEQAASEFAQLADGTYRYGLATDDLVLTLAVDAQELQKSQTRVEPFISFFLSVRYSGDSGVELDVQRATLEFKKHYRERHKPIDAQELSHRLQKDLEALRETSAREIQRDRDQQNEKQIALRDQENAISAMINFLQTRALQATTLSRNSPHASGWLFFDTQSRWIHQLNLQEEFVLRVPLGSTTLEFPFVLPPSSADINLRTRPRE